MSNAPATAVVAEDAGSPPGTNRRPRPNILLAITGSVAAIKGPELAVKLVNFGANVRVLLTKGGHNFWTKAEAYNQVQWDEMHEIMQGSKDGERGKISVYYAEDEWKEWNTLGDPVLHIDLRDWADLLLIAPLSAHTLAKLAHGLCDDTLSCVVRAWDFGHGPRPGKPILLAPAMNTAMWQHPLTRPQLDSLEGFWNTAKNPKNGISVIAPQVKTLACGEIGNGALAAVDDIVRAVDDSLSMAQQRQD